MKKLIIIIMLCFIITGCSLFNKKPNNTPISNETKNETTEVIGNETEDENVTYVEYKGKRIDYNGNSTEAQELRILDAMNNFALNNYKNEKFKTMVNTNVGNVYDKKVSLKELQNSKSFDISEIIKECNNLCDLENSFIIVDYKNEDNPIMTDLKLLNKDNKNSNLEIIFEYAQKIYSDKKYLNAKKEGNYYRVTLKELNTKYGYDISKITCDKNNTIIEFRPTEEHESNSFPIYVYGC